MAIRQLAYYPVDRKASDQVFESLQLAMACCSTVVTPLPADPFYAAFSYPSAFPRYLSDCSMMISGSALPSLLRAYLALAVEVLLVQTNFFPVGFQQPL